MDIEGAEIEVIPDLLESLQDKNLFIVGELHNWPDHLKELEKSVYSYGYTLKTYNQDSACLLFHLYKI